MPDNRNEVLELGKTAFSLLSFKIKMIIIGVVAILLIVVIFPVVALMTFSSENNKNINQKNCGNDTGSSIVVNEVVEGLKKYQGATCPMPFENWNSEKDVVTSKFSNNRTIIVNGQLQSRAHTGIDLVVIAISEPKICAVSSGKVVVAKAGQTGYGN